jgi:hypothetical protein
MGKSKEAKTQDAVDRALDKARAVDRALDKTREETRLPKGWKPQEKGARIVGIFRECRKVKCQSKDGKERSPSVFILDTEGGPVSVWATANLQPQMDKALAEGLKPGQMVAVEYDGQETTSANYKVKLFALAVIPE